METILLIIRLLFVSSLVGIGISFLLYFLSNKKVIDPKLSNLGKIIANAGWIYLKQQIKVFGLVLLVSLIVLYFLFLSGFIESIWTIVFVAFGATFSIMAGLVGYHIATIFNSLVAEASKRSLKKAKNTLLLGAAIAGIFIHSFVLLDIALGWWVIYYFEGMDVDSPFVMMVILGKITTTFGFGASIYAQFARGGGGIYTKGADVGADIAGKVVLDLEEDDILNPGTIADNVGDNVGDINGMFADFYETFIAMIVGSTLLFATAFEAARKIGFNDFGGPAEGMLFFFSLPISGLFFSMLGLLLSRAKSDNEKKIMNAQQYGFLITSFFIFVFSFFAAKYTVGIVFWYPVVIGLVQANLLSFASEYFNSYTFLPTKVIARSAESGPASIVLRMLQNGLKSGGITMILLALAVYLTYSIAPEGFELVFVAISGITMISPLALLLAYDTEGPISDNAQGMNEMTGAPTEALKVTNVLDSVGNTAAAKIKGFAIGSAIMTALVMISAYVSVVHYALSDADISLSLFNISIDNPNVLVGLVLGGAFVAIFSSELMKAVSIASEAMIKNILEQSKRFLKDGKQVPGEEPNYNECVAITTKAAQRGIIFPTLLIILAVVLPGFLGGPEMITGVLVGTLIVGALLALFQSNAGGSADNAKKYIEAGHLGGKHSDAHKSSVIADTVGDPLKDTSGPSINIMIKLMSMTAIITGPFFVYWYYL